jgi:glycine/D-amino acid oxidase-like deaminating enzyme
MSDVIVVGAGIAGCHAAYDLSMDHEVTVLDRSGIAAGATGLSAGLVAPTLFYGDAPDVARHANGFFREFDGTRGFSFTERDRLDFIPAGKEEEMIAQAKRVADEGFPVSYLDAPQVEREYPYFRLGEYVGAVKYRDTGWVDPYSYATALASESRARGVTFETDVTVDEILVGSDDAVKGVSTDDERYEASTVVVACGWRTPTVLPSSERVPLRPYRTQAIVLNPDEPLPDTFPLGRLRSDHLYFRPEHNGDLLVGGAHALVSDPHGASGDADESFKLDVASYLPELFDGLGDAEFVNGWAGLDAATPDARPIIDSVGPDGLVVATGFNGLGVMASPVVGPTVRERMTGERASFPAELFGLDRFDSVSSEFEYISTSDI